MSKESLEVVLAVCRVLLHCGVKLQKSLDDLSAQEVVEVVTKHFNDSKKLERTLDNKVRKRIYALNNTTGELENGTTKKAN